jgi:TatD DNase family protein
MFDSHCHLTDAKFDEDRAVVIARAWDAGLRGLVTIASDVEDARAALEIARREPRIRCTAGVHPHAAAHTRPDDFAAVRALAEDPAVVAIGEAGLDFHYDNSPRDVQRDIFDRQLGIAADTGLPIVVHSRSADADTAAMIRAATGVRGVLHCFAGGPDLLDAGLDAGWFVSFAGLITFRNFDNADLLRATPADRLLLETDSPYLAPVPHRGRRNEPAFLAETCRAAAALRGETFAETAAATTANALRCYGLDTGVAP